ncbi:MAG: chemotaxis protein CheW [Lachnospiraceae bacterium]|nr:chemotaxis protein CheW [Lachnospiraceae bacterium]
MDEVKNIADSTQFIVIKIGNEQFGIDIKYIDNIVRMQNITRVPKVPEYFNGVINLRGEVIPVMSLRLKMGLETDEFTKMTRIIIIKLEQHEGIGIIVDEVKEVMSLENEQIEKVSYDKEEKKTFVYGVGKVEESLVSLLDLNAVLAENQDK